MSMWKLNAMNSNLSITTAPLNILVGKRYTDLQNTANIMSQLGKTGLVDGFEFQDLAEWDERGAPRDDRTKTHRNGEWQKCAKFSNEEKATNLLSSGFPTLSIHANRDVGIYLCSEKDDEREHGKRLVRESYQLADLVGARIVVFHLWDTWKENFDPSILRNDLNHISSEFPDILAAVENVPTHLEGKTPFDIVRKFPHITLDTRWAGMYDELAAFEELKGRIVNVHLRGAIEDGQWALLDAPYSFDDALQQVIHTWGYSGLFTLEPEGGKSIPSWDEIISAITKLRGSLGLLS